VHCLQDCVSMMKKDKSLNSNDDTALYGLTGSIPDKSLLREFVAIHQAAMLDTIYQWDLTFQKFSFLILDKFKIQY